MRWDNSPSTISQRYHGPFLEEDGEAPEGQEGVISGVDLVVVGGGWGSALSLSFPCVT